MVSGLKRLASLCKVALVRLPAELEGLLVLIDDALIDLILDVIDAFAFLELEKVHVFTLLRDDIGH